MYLILLWMTELLSLWRDKMLKVGTKEEIKQFLKEHNTGFYVYILYHPNKTPFYVGKGKGNRVFQHEYEVEHSQYNNPYKINTIKKIYRLGGTVGYGIDNIFEQEADAFARERELVKQIGRPPLTNLTDGGEGAVNLDPISKQKHNDTLWGDTGDNPRSIINRTFQELAPVKSVPIKPLQQFKAVHLTPHPKARNYSPREAAALFISSVFNGVLIEEGAIIPRLVNIKGVDGIIENGVGRDILVAGWATIIPNDDPTLEQFQLTKSGKDAIQRYIKDLPKEVLNRYM